MLNPMISDALKLGGVKDWQPCGTIALEKMSTKGEWAGQLVRIELYFYSAEELGKAVEWATKNGYKPVGRLADELNQTIAPLDVQSTAPTCPVHHVPMKKSNNGKGWYCSKKVPGGFCTERSK